MSPAGIEPATVRLMSLLRTAPRRWAAGRQRDERHARYVQSGARRVRKLVCGSFPASRSLVSVRVSLVEGGLLLWSFVYLVVRNLFALVWLLARPRRSKELELAVLRRQIPRPGLRESDRVFLAAASRFLGGASRSSFFVRPDTLLGWHRQLVRRRGRMPEGDPVDPRSPRRLVRWCCGLRVRTRGGVTGGSSA